MGEPAAGSAWWISKAGCTNCAEGRPCEASCSACTHADANEAGRADRTKAGGHDAEAGGHDAEAKGDDDEADCANHTQAGGDNAKAGGDDAEAGRADHPEAGSHDAEADRA